MEVLREDLMEQEIGTSPESFQKFLDSQRELFHSQIDQLQSIVVTQCKLTGVNPLAQEMAAGALSIKIGKRPRDLLNPKAVKYMQSIFSIKDAITKKDSREIGALFGVTVTQVRDFFNSQRSRVRKFVRLSREKALRLKASRDSDHDFTTDAASVTPVDPVPLNSIAPNSVGEAPSSPTSNDLLPGINEAEKEFVDKIFMLMGKEETFSGQVKLLEWVLRVENSSVLSWFMTHGGIMILATWLSQAAIEEQTSVLFIILEVLSHLPLYKALPSQLSAVLQTVNRLRFYRTSDVSNRAKALLSKWSKMFARNQTMKKANGTNSSNSLQKGRMVKQSFGNGEEAWQSDNSIPEEILASCGSLDSTRKLESSQAVKLLPASADDSNRKHILGPASSQNRERRKVLLVEQPGQKMAGRSQQASKVTSSSHSRPVSVDDIKKAKMRQLYMQNKYGKSGFMSNESNEIKTEGSLKPSITRTGNLPSTKVNVRADVEEQKNVVPSKVPHKIDTSFPKTKLDPRETVLENCKRVQISWKIPAEVKLSDVWRVGGGEESKEIEIQKNRIRRERETVYRTVQEMPPNPKEPWDEEMDYDDSLTPVISIEQLPDTDIIPEPQPNGVVGSAAESASSSSHNPGAAEPDLELLAVLLKNPDLVLALTSGGARSLSSEDTVRLLDMIKAGGGAANLIAGNLNGGVSTSSSSSAGGRREERVEVSLPSPTPSVDPGTGSWAADGTRNPFSRHASTSAASYNRSAAYQVANPSTVALSATTVLPSPTPSRYPAAVPQHARNMQGSLSQSVQSTSMAPSFHNRIPTNSAAIPSQVPEVFNSLENNVSNLHPYRLSAAVASEMPVNSHSLSVPLQQQQHAQPIQLSQQPSYPGVSRSVSMGKQSSSNMSSLWRGGSSQPHQYNHSHSHSQPNQTNFNVSSRAHWDRNNYASNESETWSPGNSPKGYAVGRNILEPRVAPGRTREAESSRHGNSSGYWEQGRHGGRWQRDHRY